MRVEYAGAYYHVMARGNRREEIFLDEEDRRFSLKAVSEVCAQMGWRVHAWVLMGTLSRGHRDTGGESGGGGEMVAEGWGSWLGKGRGVLRMGGG